MLQFGVSTARLVIFGTGIACSLPAAIAITTVVLSTAIVTGYVIGKLSE